MNELKEILGAWRRNRRAPGVLATVVHVEGSAYRRPGARMLIGGDGTRIGTISGGCLEGDVVRKAAWWTAAGDPVLRVYDTMSGEDDAAWEFGLGCNGRIHVLLERMECAATQALLEHLDQCQSARRETVVATVLRSDDGCAYRTGDHFFAGSLSGSVGVQAAEALCQKRSRLFRLPEADFFLEYAAPPQQLVIFGAGHDALPVVAAAASLGWSVTVADVRSGYAKAERFPGAARVVTLPASGDISSLEIGPDAAVLLMTHNYPLDTRLLPLVWPLAPRYLGLLGPWRRTGKLFAEVGIEPRGANLFAPVGLDLGGESPESIALSIVTEIQSAINGRSARSLRWRTASIHDAVHETGDAPEPLARAFEPELAVCERANG